MEDLLEARGPQLARIGVPHWSPARSTAFPRLDARLFADSILMMFFLVEHLSKAHVACVFCVLFLIPYFSSLAIMLLLLLLLLWVFNSFSEERKKNKYKRFYSTERSDNKGVNEE